MASLNRIPRGFLNWVYAQSGGRNPGEYSETVSPIVDMGPFYDGDRLSTEFISVTPTVQPESAILTVPDDETWKLMAIGIAQTVVAATDTFEVTVSLRRTANLGATAAFAPIWAPERQTAVNLFLPEQMTAAILLPQPLVLLAGTEVIMNVEHQFAFRAITMSLVVVRMSG